MAYSFGTGTHEVCTSQPEDLVWQEGKRQVLLLLPTSDSKLLARWQGHLWTLHAWQIERFYINLLKEFQEPLTASPAVCLAASFHLSCHWRGRSWAIVPHKCPWACWNGCVPSSTCPAWGGSAQSPPESRCYSPPQVQQNSQEGSAKAQEGDWSDGAAGHHWNVNQRVGQHHSPKEGWVTEVPHLQIPEGCVEVWVLSDTPLWQPSLASETKELTVFSTPYGKFQFKVMPFGLQEAPASFQGLMEQVLRGVPQSAAAYEDDIIIFSHTWKEHLAHFWRVLHLITKWGVGRGEFNCWVWYSMSPFYDLFTM